MKKHLLLGITLVASATGLEAKGIINRMPINKIPAHLGNEVAPMEMALKKAQTKFINKILPAAYEFAGEYIQAMHPETHVNPKQVIARYKAALRAYKTAVNGFWASKLGREYAKAQKRFYAQPKEKRNWSKFQANPIVKQARAQLRQLRHLSAVAIKFRLAQSAYNNLPSIKHHHAETHVNPKQVIASYKAALRAYKDAVNGFWTSKLGREYAKAQKRFYSQPKEKRNWSEFQAKSVVKKARAQLQQLRHSSPVAIKFRAAQKAYNNLPSVKRQHAEELERLSHSGLF